MAQFYHGILTALTYRPVSKILGECTALWGGSVSSNAMDAQARAEWLVRRGWCGVAAVAWLLSLLQSQRPTCDVGWHSSALAWLLSLQSQRPTCDVGWHSSAVAWLLSPLQSQRPTCDVGWHSSAVAWLLSLLQSQRPTCDVGWHSSAVAWLLSLSSVSEANL